MNLHQPKLFKQAGRKSNALPDVLGLRALDPNEVEAQAARAEGVSTSPLQRLTNRHRRMASAIASGQSQVTVARLFGVTPARVGQLMRDPSFKELVNRHELELHGMTYGLMDMSEDLSKDTIGELMRRLDEEPESFTNDELTRIGQVFADRAGFAPKRVEEKNFTFNFGDKLEEARQRVIEAAVDITPEKVEEG